MGKERIFSYRGYEVPIYVDEPGQQYRCVLDGEEIGFGAYNLDYEGDLKYLIDEKLDTVRRFGKPYFGAALKWFDNGGWRDLKLTYRLRAVKVWQMDQENPDVEGVLREAEEFLKAAIGENGKISFEEKRLN